MPQSTFTIAQLDRALRDEAAADRAAEVAEGERRSAWWATTWLLAACPRDQWAEAKRRYRERTGHSGDHAQERRTIGSRFTEVGLGTYLPMPRFAQVAAAALGTAHGERGRRVAMPDQAVTEMVERLRAAEDEGVSLREFSQALTGRSWTSTPENLTQADEDRIIERAARERPDEVANRIASAAPEAAARATEGNRQASTAASRIRLDRASDPEQRRRLRQRNERTSGRMGSARDEATSTMEATGLVDHEATLRARTARSWLRKMVAEQERNPAMTPEQREELDLVLAECDHLIALGRGGSEHWNDTDRDFLAAVGIEGAE